MKKLFIAAAIALCASLDTSAQTVPFLLAPQIPFGGGATVTPPGGCSNSLDFSQACNSQYITLVMP